MTCQQVLGDNWPVLLVIAGLVLYCLGLASGIKIGRRQ